MFELYRAGRGQEVRRRRQPDANAKTKGGVTALQLLLKWRSPERVLPSIAWLPQQGTGVNSRGAKLRTAPLHLAAQRGHASAVVFLLQKGAAVDAVDDDGNTALHT